MTGDAGKPNSARGSSGGARFAERHKAVGPATACGGNPWSIRFGWRCSAPAASACVISRSPKRSPSARSSRSRTRWTRRLPRPGDTGPASTGTIGSCWPASGSTARSSPPRTTVMPRSVSRAWSEGCRCWWRSRSPTPSHRVAPSSPPRRNAACRSRSVTTAASTRPSASRARRSGAGASAGSQRCNACGPCASTMRTTTPGGAACARAEGRRSST